MKTGAARHVCFELRDARREALFAQSWEPIDQAVGGVAIVHGLGEHSSRYAHVAEKLAGEGYLVLTQDQRGHGQSGGQRGHVAEYSWLLDDIERLVKELRERLPSGPIFLYGHSLGGNLVLNYSLRRRSPVAGIIASSPLLLPAVTPPPWKRSLARFLNYVWPSFTFRTGIRSSDLSHDPAALAARESDPLIHHRVSARLAVQMMAAGRWSLAHATELATPALILHGTADPVTDCAASIEFAKRASDCCTLRTFPGLLHELHWEFERDEILSSVIQWMQDEGLHGVRENMNR
jgi:alpha-beta hydrolase superfamily lysophospholipase